MKKLLTQWVALLLLMPLSLLAADPPAGGPQSGGGYKTTSDVTDWVLFIGIIIVAVLVFYSITRLIRGRGMRG